MNKLKIEYVPIGSIKKYERNAKLHPAEQVGQIKRSIEEFGFNDLPYKSRKKWSEING